MEISIIAAIGNNRELGWQGKIPWRLKTDMSHFRELTTGHPVVMGRKTFESIGRSLPDRTNVVITRNPEFLSQDCLIANSLPRALNLLTNLNSEVFIIGGAEIYAQAFPLATKLYLTIVNYNGPADVFFPEFDYSNWKITNIEAPTRTEKDDRTFEFLTYERTNPIDSPPSHD